MMPNDHPASQPGALALAIERAEWERIALHLFVALADALREDGRPTIDDLIDLLEDGSEADDD